MHNLESAYIIIIIFFAAVAVYEYRLILNQKKQLNSYEKIRKKLFETSEKISKTNDEDEIYSIVLDTIVQLIPNATKGSVLLYNESDDKFYFKVVKGFQKDLENISLKKEETYLYKINEFKETIIINNPEEFDKEHVDKVTIEGFHKINALDISSTISAPIYTDKFIGLINVDSNIPGHVFKEKDLDLMEQIKCELELAIKNALAQNKLKYLANYDELTGLINRRKLKKEFDMEIERLKINSKTSSLVMIDMDDFKNINDTYGHYYGDMILKKFSAILRNSVDKHDIVARFAGDEFIVILKDHNILEADNKMNYLKDQIISKQFGDVKLNFCYGICEIKPMDNTSFDEALSIADIKMYDWKRVKVSV